MPSGKLSVGIAGMTISEVKGFGRQRGHTEVYRGAEYKVEYVPKIKVEVLAAAETADDIVEAIAKRRAPARSVTARSGSPRLTT